MAQRNEGVTPSFASEFFGLAKNLATDITEKLLLMQYAEHPGSDFDRFCYTWAHAAVYGIGKVAFQFRVEGAQHQISSGRVLYPFNHLSGADTVFSGAAIEHRHLTEIGRRGIMESPGVGTFFRIMGAETIDRPERGEAASEDTMEIIEAPLLADRAEGLFASGTRTPGFMPGWPKRGFAKAAYDTQSRVVVSVIKGTDRLWDQRVTARFGHSMPPPRRRGESLAFMYRYMIAQRWEFNSIPHHNNGEYQDPLEPIINDYLGGELPLHVNEFLRAYRQYRKDHKIKDEDETDI